ncbi:hypothetical protein L916_11728 [Phytophthora nicotianae]|uniref:Uncharacterized protein n=1 Tax=Phytophthora nicotianae TaxID=4792 RepID=W2IPV3_PHYNI|nr:hypothetical protein L916_11728 [Phytophthora nicotianae]
MTVMDLCLICYRPVYHLCSNDLFDPNNIAVRFCNTPCVVEWKAKNLPEATVAEDTQRVAFDISGWSQDSSAQQASQEAAEPPSSQSSEETLPPESLVAVDSYGIPRDVHHYRQPGKRDNVWDVAHILATPYACLPPSSWAQANGDAGMCMALQRRRCLLAVSVGDVLKAANQIIAWR